jgi:hypothetical protein
VTLPYPDSSTITLADYPLLLWPACATQQIASGLIYDEIMDDEAMDFIVVDVETDLARAKRIP